MRTTPHNDHRRVHTRWPFTLACCAAALVALAAAPLGTTSILGGGPPAPALATGYGWPVEPFDRQHAVRGYFGDPRIGRAGARVTRSLHFGVDISCPDGTRVYATLTGRVVVEAAHPEVVAIVDEAHDVTFSYWHVVPAVRNGQRAVAYGTVLGRVAKGWAHVHFTELRGGAYVNPLRPGAMGPYADPTRPTLKGLSIERASRTLASVPSSGQVDLVVEAFDTTPIAVAAPWHDKPVTPALLRWRVAGAGSWRTAFDVRRTIPAAARYAEVYAAWTRQNSPWGVRGRYRFYLARGLDARLFGRGLTIEVEAGDTRGNTTTQRFKLAA
jgi:murein DD-endopeptidase MepM/ murein hydrolase activator NlpD